MNKNNIYNKLNNLIFDKTNFIVLQEADLLSIKETINNKLNLKINKIKHDLNKDFKIKDCFLEKIKYLKIIFNNFIDINFLNDKEKIILNKIYLDIDLFILDLNTIDELASFKKEINSILDTIISKEKNYEEFFNEDINEYQRKIKKEIINNFKNIINIELKNFNEIEDNIELLEKSEKIIKNLNKEIFNKIEKNSNIKSFKKLDIIYSKKKIVSKIMYKLNIEFPEVYDILLKEKNIINKIIEKEPKHLNNYIFMLENLFSYNEQIKVSEVNIIIDMINNIKEENEEIKIELLFDLKNNNKQQSIIFQTKKIKEENKYINFIKLFNIFNVWLWKWKYF